MAMLVIRLRLVAVAAVTGGSGCGGPGAQAALDTTRGLLHEQRTGFRPDRWSLVAGELEAMDVSIDRARRLCRRAHWMRQTGTDNRVEAAMAKAFSPRTSDIVGGTGRIQRKVIARELAKRAQGRPAGARAGT